MVVIIQAISLAYPNQTNNINIEGMVALWYMQLKDFNFSDVSKVVNDWIATNKFIPTIADIKENLSIGIEYKNPWYKHFKQKGNIIYNDEDISWATFEDWKMIPDELSKRMTYTPDKNDKTRNLILKQIEEMKRGLNRET